MRITIIHIAIVIVFRQAILLLYRLHLLQLGAKFLCQQLRRNLRFVSHVRHKGIDVVGSQHRLCVERNITWAIGIKQLHIDPSTDGKHLRILPEHTLLLRSDCAGRIAHGNICITAIDDVVIIANLQIGACTVLPIFRVFNITEIDNGANGIAHERRRIDQIATTLIQDDVTLANILQRLENTPVRIQNVVSYLI